MDSYTTWDAGVSGIAHELQTTVPIRLKHVLLIGSWCRFVLYEKSNFLEDRDNSRSPSPCICKMSPYLNADTLTSMMISVVLRNTFRNFCKFYTFLRFCRVDDYKSIY